METILTIKIRTKDWTEGNHAWFDAKLKPNSLIEVEWGDGTRSIMQTYDIVGWCRVAHYYKSAEGKEIPFTIIFKSENSEALEGLVDGTWETNVEKVTLEDCPGLKYLQYTQLPLTVFNGAPNIETLVVNEYYGAELHVSCLLNLKKLICRSSSNIRSLDLTHNDELSELDISFCRNLGKIMISNQSQLSLLANDKTHIDRLSLEWLSKTVEKNKGQIQKEWLDEEYYSSGCYGEEI